MSTRKLTHPAFPGVSKTVKAADAKKWERAGWLSEPAPKKATAKPENTPVLKVNHQHD